MKKTGRLLCILLAFIMAASLLTAVLADPYTGKVVFTDVDPNSDYASYIYDIYERGITKGTSETTFNPLDNMTRAQFVTFIGRMADVDTTAYSGCPFEDVTDIFYWATPYITWAYERGITTGTSETTFNPGDYVTREQMATFMCRYADAYGVKLQVSGKTPADAAKVSDWAEMGVKIFGGFLIDFDAQGNFNPQSYATRQEMAKVLSLFPGKDGPVDPPAVSGNQVIINGVTYTLEPTDKTQLVYTNTAGYEFEYEGLDFTRVYNETITDEMNATIKCADGTTARINCGQLRLAVFGFYVDGDPISDSYGGTAFISRFVYPTETGDAISAPLEYVTEITIR